MSFLSDFFSPNTVNKTVDAIYDTGDALFYTDEEIAKAHQESMKTKISLLGAFAPFKLIQRHIALVFTYNFIAMIWLTIIVGFLGDKAQLEMLLKIFGIFSIGWIMLAIVTFYFGGGTIDSFRNKP